MKIMFCNNTNYALKYPQKSFKAHPDFYKLKKNYDIKVSSYFRRGQFYGSPSTAFADVVKVLNGVFGQTPMDIQKMLIAGIGDSQEPFSLLAVIKCILNDEKLNDKLDLHVIDLQSKPSDKTLFVQSYCDGGISPQYAKSSFIEDNGRKYGLQEYKKYRVKDEIFEFLKNTYNNSEKSHWDSRLQDVAKDLPYGSFDVISVNNTIGYIREEGAIIETLSNIVRILKRGGIFITDPYSKFNKFFKNQTYEIYKGIFKKV